MGEFVLSGRGHIVLLQKHIPPEDGPRTKLFYKNISRTSAVSSTNFGSILIFASCLVVLVIYYVGEFVLNGRGHIVLLQKHIDTSIVYIFCFSPLYGWCWYLEKYFKDVSREFNELRVNTHLCKMRWWLVLVVYYVGEFFEWEGCACMFCFFSTIMVGVGIFTLGGEF